MWAEDLNKIIQIEKQVLFIIVPFQRIILILKIKKCHTYAPKNMAIERM